MGDINGPKKLATIFVLYPPSSSYHEGNAIYQCLCVFLSMKCACVCAGSISRFLFVLFCFCFVVLVIVVHVLGGTFVVVSYLLSLFCISFRPCIYMCLRACVCGRTRIGMPVFAFVCVSA